jgi:hypothetical protein
VVDNGSQRTFGEVCLGFSAWVASPDLFPWVDEVPVIAENLVDGISTSLWQNEVGKGPLVFAGVLSDVLDRSPFLIRSAGACSRKSGSLNAPLPSISGTMQCRSGKFCPARCDLKIGSEMS